jgi:hypothetical protein
LGQRPDAKLLGAVLTRNEAIPRMLVLYSRKRDAIEFTGWDEVPQARSSSTSC